MPWPPMSHLPPFPPGLPKVREIYPTAQAFLSDDDLKLSLQAWGRKGKATNMHLERLLARYRTAAKFGADGPPHAQRVVSGGCMSQILQSHLAAGGTDPRHIRRGELLEKGVPLRAAKRGRQRQPNKCRAKIMYAQERLGRHQDIAPPDSACF